MKKLLLLICIIGIGLTSSAQNSRKSEKIVVSVDDLTPEQLENARTKNKVEQVSKQLETYGKFAGMGREVGVAVKEGLGAVKDVTLEFADSDLGKLTMALIVWKVAGKDIVGIIFGIFFWITTTILFIWSYRKSILDRRVLIKTEGGFFGIGGKKEYEVVRSHYTEGEPLWYALFMIITTAATAGIMFG